MFVLITYDVSTKTKEGRRRLRQVAKACQNYGQRVQASVFECVVDPEQLERLRIALLRIHHPDEDSIRLYRLGKNWKNRVEHLGTKHALDLEGPLIL